MESTAQGLIDIVFSKMLVTSPTTAQYNAAFTELKMILETMAADSLQFWAKKSDTFTPINAVSAITFADGSVLSPDIEYRPNYIEDLFITDDDGIRYPIDLVGSADYFGEADTTLTGRPYKAFYSPGYPTATLYLFPIADDANDTLNIKYKDKLYTLANLSTVIAIPGEYQRPIIYELLKALSGTYGYALTLEDRELAHTSERAVITINSKHNTENPTFPSDIKGM